MSLLKLKAAAANRIAPETFFGGPVLAALEERGPAPGAGACAFRIVEDLSEEAYTIDLGAAEIYVGIPDDARCELVLHATAFDALLRGKAIDSNLAAHEGGAEIYGDPDMLSELSELLTASGGAS